MRRLFTTSLIFFVSASLPYTISAQLVSTASDGSLAGAHEFGIFATGRILSTEYSVADARTAFGAAATFATHIKSSLAVEGGLGMSYGRQLNSYYKPPLFTFTPTISLVVQRSTSADMQPYALVGAGYEFIRFTKPRCDCDQSRSLGVGHVGVGFRKMMGSSRAFRAELTSQIGKGGAAFTGMAGFSFFQGAADRFGKQRTMRTPGSVRKEPPLIPVPRQSTTIQPATRPAATTPRPAPEPAITTPVRPVGPSPLPAGVGAVLLQIDGTQVDFSKPTWRDDAEPVIDGLVVDLTSDAGQGITLSIEAHTDNVGSNAGNIMLGLDRARAVRDYLVSQGVAAARIRISSAGEDKAIAANTTAIGRQQNRRITIRRDN